MVKVALAGCAHIHTPGFIKMFQERADIQVQGVWDHDAARGKQRAQELQTEYLPELHKILDDQGIKAVIVCSETNRHEDLVSRITESKKHLFVEKPLGMGSRDATAMADMIERAGVIFQTGYANRGIPAIQFIRDQVNLRTFGKITRARYTVCHSGALQGWFDTEWRWMTDPAQAGVGAFGDLGTHGLDILVWLFGDVARVAASFNNGTARYPNCEETGEAIIVFKSGVIASLAAAWDDLSNPVPLQVSGTHAHAAIIHEKLYFRSTTQPSADGEKPIPEDGLPRHWAHAFDLFLDAITGKDVPLVSAREAAYRSIVMDAIYQADRQRSWIALP